MEHCEIGIVNENNEIEEHGIEVKPNVARFSKERFNKVICYECQHHNPIAREYIEKNSQPKDITKNYPNINEKSGNWQEDIMNFETLLNIIHEKFEGKFSIRTEIIDLNMEQKWAIVHATITINNGKQIQIFQGTGDATQENCQSSMIKPHFIRMAETRAIARALRWATNNTKTAEEEK